MIHKIKKLFGKELTPLQVAGLLAPVEFKYETKEYVAYLISTNQLDLAGRI